MKVSEMKKALEELNDDDEIIVEEIPPVKSYTFKIKKVEEK
tara:strand:- start:1532 stop:1654 length:123 start_codon:yes stop_codon:yes gene_type:complete